MLSAEQLRKIDPNFKDLSDDEIIKIRNAFYEAAELMFDVWKEEKFGSK